MIERCTLGLSGWDWTLESFPSPVLQIKFNELGAHRYKRSTPSLLNEWTL